MENQDYPLPVGDTKRSAKNLLPRYFRTETNSKFIQSTIDSMISEGVVEKLDAYVGRRNSPSTVVTDNFLPDISADRENYQFESSIVYKDDLDNVDFFATYNDYMGMVKTFKGASANHSALNSQQSYSWDPQIDWDKFTNFREYFWLPLGPEPVGIAGRTRNTTSVYNIVLGQDDQVESYLFTPDGITKNPSLKLYKGQTYEFVIDCPGQPFSIASNIAFVDNDPLLQVDAENVSTLYNTGITKYKVNEEGTYIETQDDFIEQGKIVFVVPDEVPDTLFYLSQNDANITGIFSFYNIVENSQINVEEEILGMKTYENDTVKLSNGMKVYFQGEVTPAKYASGYYFVEGVGSSIQLVNEQDLEIPTAFTSTKEVPFDEDGFGFDKYPYEDASAFLSIKDYICINRSSPDRNPWSRYNRWFHRDIIEASFVANGLPIVFDENARAKRPIIEYAAGLQLYNHGNLAKTNVDLIDTFTPDVFSTIEGSGGYIIDGVEVTNGMRILFTADPDILVNGKIYEVKFILFGTGTVKNRQITLIETSDTNPTQGATVLVKRGNVNAGKMYHYHDTKWIPGQEKTKVNEQPHFDLFDSNGNSYSDTTQYLASSFTGTKLFSYRVGTGTNDTELGFPLAYESINNFGDIVFDFNYHTDTWNYQDEIQNKINAKTDSGFFKLFDSNGNYEYKNVWTKTKFKSRQAVIRQYNSQLNNFDIDMFNDSNNLTDLIVKVYVNGKRKIQDTDYVVENSVPYKRVRFLKNLTSESIVTLKCYSAATKNLNGYYEIPQNLESNPLNENLTTFTLGEVTKHVNTILENLGSSGRGQAPGNTNLRDILPKTQSSFGTQFVKHSGPFNLAAYHIVDKEANIMKSIQYASKEYSRFKRAFLYESSRTGFHGDVRQHVDLIMNKLNKDKTESAPFFSSDVIPINASTATTNTVEYNETAYLPTSFSNFTLTKLGKKAVLVYVNDEQKLHNVDYTFEDGFIKYTNPTVGQDIVVYEYENTNGCYVPPTPTKLGLYPLYTPERAVITNALGTQNVIVGHDGSYTVEFGDYRDDLLLELEKRIYNNCKQPYNPEYLNIHEFIGGTYRDTNVTRETIDGLILDEFSSWLSAAGNPNYTENTNWDGTNGFTFNYRNSVDENGNRLPGGWRAIFKQHYDTDRPHTHPWEMLGFSIKPSWWETQYGPAPYTYSNTVMWQDLRDGFVKEPGKATVQLTKYMRPNLLSIIPVNDSGELQSPLDSGIAKGFLLPASSEDFTYGDQGPVESAFRNSSEYRFGLLKAWTLTQPSKVFGLGFDASRIKKDMAGNYVYSETNQQISTKDLVFPSIANETTQVYTSGLVNYIANYVKWSVESKYTTYQTTVKGLDNQLSIKLGGFAEKTKLKLLLDSRSPLNKTTVFVPDENYKIFLNTSGIQDIAVLSGVIITKTQNGYIIGGYDTLNPTFTIYPYMNRNGDSAINVGGVSEDFVNWSSDQTYVIGTIVRFENNFYRAKVSHESEENFEIEKYTKLAELPITGGKDAIIRKMFDKDNQTTIPYGTIYKTEQEVVDFLLGYEEYLKVQGWNFENLNPESGLPEDFLLLVKEFLFFTTQNWDNETVLAISPAANKVEFKRDKFTIDNLFDAFYDVNILDSSGNFMDSSVTSIFRNDDNTFTIRTVDSDRPIYLIKLPLVQKEHTVLLDNKTVFADTIYDKSAGFRQERIKLVGYRTDGWNGSLSIPGFFYDEAKVVQWVPNADYKVSNVVKHKEFYYSAFSNHTSGETFNDSNWRRLDERPVSQIYPNWDYKANQFADFYDLDTDNFDSEQQRLAQHLIGYQKRQYLENIITDSVSQYKFYQGFIQEKGTSNSVTKLFDALSNADNDSVELYEEWAIRLGQYGSIENIAEIEYQLNENNYKLEPQIYELNASKTIGRSDLIIEIPSTGGYKVPDDYDHTIVSSTTSTSTYTKDSGYVRNNDVEYIVTSRSDITSINIDELEIGKHVWITKDKQAWTVLKHTRSDLEVTGFVNITNTDGSSAVKITLDRQVEGIEKDDIIGIFSSIPNFKGFYKVSDVLANTITFTVSTTDGEIDFEEEDDSFSGVGGASLSRFVERRFANIEDLNNLIEDIQKDQKDRLWVDDNGTGNFSVYENNSIVSLQQEYANANTTFAKSTDINNSNTTLVTGDPNDASLDFTGTATIKRRNSPTFAFTNDQILSATDATDDNSGYGTSVAVSPDSKFIVVGAPLADNALSQFKGTLDPTEAYLTGDIVVDRGTLWRAKNDVSNWHTDASDSSSIGNSDNRDWEPAYYIPAGVGTSSGLSNQGVIYIYELDNETRQYEQKIVMTSPDPNASENFGTTLQIRKASNGIYKLFVGATGAGQGRVYFFEYNTDWRWTRNRNYKGVFDQNEEYRTTDIVFYQGQLYEALVERPSSTPTGQKLPTDTASWKISEDIEHTGFVPNRDQDLDGDLDTGEENFGEKIAIDTLGDKIVVSSTVNGLRRLTVYHQPVDRWKFIQTFDEDVLKRETWGKYFDINDDGTKIAVAAPYNDDVDTDAGTVYVYKQNSNNVYELQQNIRSPYNDKCEAFGSSVSFSKNKLAITGKNSNLVERTTFDENGMLLDNGNTDIKKIIPDTGRIILFQEINDLYVYAEDVDYRRNTATYEMENIVLNDNHLYLKLDTYIPTSENNPEATNNKYVTSPNPGLIVDFSFATGKDTWSELTTQIAKPNIEQLQQVFLYAKDTADIIQRLDVIDPRQGKIAGPAEQELSFKTWYDPATYSSSSDTSDVIVDAESNWTDRYVGKLWWNLKEASWYNPYQGNSQYRTNTFNKLLPNSRIQVCEWVESDLLPSEWNAQTGTTAGYTKGISGTALYDDDTVSSKQVYDRIKQGFTTKYYYWVENAQIVPRVAGRSLSCESISNLIADPAGTGYRFVSLLENNKFALYNCKNLVQETNTILHFRKEKDTTINIPIHREYDLMTEGLDLSMPNDSIEQKWIDSLIGYDNVGNPVPDITLAVTKKYGVLNQPRQSMFINRVEAVKQFVDRVNSVFVKNLIVDNYSISKLLLVDPLPLAAEGKFDRQVDTVSELQFVGTAKNTQAVLTPVIEFGKITGVTINNPGNGYKTAPNIEIEDVTGKRAEITSTINSNGQITSVTVKDQGYDYTPTTFLKVRPFSVLVTADETIGGRWAVYIYNKTTAAWERTDNQNFDTTKYWSYTDWYASGYSESTVIHQVIDGSYQLFGLDNSIGDVVKIKNIGTGGWLLLKKTDNQDTEDYTINYDTIGRENGTIKLLDVIYNYTTETTGYDAGVYDITFYDREPVNELRNIIDAIKTDIFIGDLAVEYNKLFFASVRYVLSEQDNVDWVFKSSFLRAKHNVGDLKQKVAYQNDNLENYQDYINEVKPFKTEVREYISAYQKIEPTQSMITDFDLPPSYIGGKITPSAAKFNNNEVTNLWEKYFTYPYKNWVDNNTYEIIRIDVADGGSGFYDTPAVTISGESGITAKAYVAKGKVKSIEILNKGSRVLSAPTITVSGNQSNDGTAVRATVVLGNPNVRSTHMTVKFDRISGKKYFETIDKTETFTGTGAQEIFTLQWPINQNITTYSVSLNNVELLDTEYSVVNKLDTTKGYDRYVGEITLVTEPKIDDTLVVKYKKDTALLHAADRIFYEYDPTTGMPGKEFSQLMTGVEYEGALYDSFDFGGEQGFGVGGFSDLPWDTFDNTYDDEIIKIDGSTNIITLSSPLESGAEYNLYLNGVRLDDPQYDGSTITANKNAVMATIIGDGVQTEIDISNIFDVTIDDEVIVRKQSSDGSFSPVGSTFDTALQGGALDRTTATGIPSGEITVDGDGFFTPTNSGGPEELVPGTVTDTLDLQVYTRQNDGQAQINVAHYIFDGSTREFAYPEKPFGEDNVVVMLDKVVLRTDTYSNDYSLESVFIDSDIDINVGSIITVMTFGANGNSLIDSKTIEINEFDLQDSSAIQSDNWRFVTAADYSSDASCIVILNGAVQTEGSDYFLNTSNTTEPADKLVIEITGGRVRLDQGNVIQYAVYDSGITSYSQINNDYSWSNGTGNYWNFTDTFTPINDLPLGHNLLVFGDEDILSPGYSIRFTTTSSLSYDIDGWQFANLSSVAKIDFIVYVNDVRLDASQWSWDNVNARITLLNTNVAPVGSKLDIYCLQNADYYFIDTTLTFTTLDGSTAFNMESQVTVGEPLLLISGATSTRFEPIVKSVNGNTVVVQSMASDIRDEFIADEDFYVTADSTAVKISEIEFIDSDSISINPDIYDDLFTTYRAMHFSNHDINQFRRFTYDVLTETVVNENTDEFARRNLLSSGIVQLETAAAGAQYVWVVKNKRLLHPIVDYEVMENLNAVRLKDIVNENDRIQVMHWAAPVSSDKFGYRIFRDMLGRTHYKRLSKENSYMIANPVSPYDNKIVLVDATGIQQPDIVLNLPGIIWIDGERIEYFAVQENTLSQLRRGTLGTGVKDLHAAGDIAYGQGSAETIDYRDTYSVYRDRADGSNQIVDLGFDIDNANEIEVFVGGRKLSKVDISVYNKTLAQDSPEADQTQTKEYEVVTVGGNKYIQFTTTPAVDTEIRVVKRTGKTWIAAGETLRNSNSAIARFIRGATIELPK